MEWMGLIVTAVVETSAADKLQPAGALGNGAGQTLQHVPTWTVQLPI